MSLDESLKNGSVTLDCVSVIAPKLDPGVVSEIVKGIHQAVQQVADRYGVAYSPSGRLDQEVEDSEGALTYIEKLSMTMGDACVSYMIVMMVPDAGSPAVLGAISEMAKRINTGVRSGRATSIGGAATGSFLVG